MKLKINTAAGTFDIINTILVAFSWLIVILTGINKSTVTSHAVSGTSTLTSGTAIFFYIMLGIGLILHIVALVQSRKADISITGHVLGIIGCGLFLLSMVFALPTFILLIIAAVFTLKQAPAKH
ncbi:transporter [Dellaglioa sp. P0083]|uniref:transporter n=1 Tax=Dellaglioa kimchii TaxID=3344667 RepID=UPI0038D49A46